MRQVLIIVQIGHLNVFYLYAFWTKSQRSSLLSCSSVKSEVIRQLEEQFLASSTDKPGLGMVDVTLPLQVLFNSFDRNIAKARLRVDDGRDEALLVVVIGMRSEILSVFEKERRGASSAYLPCDMIGLTPALASVLVGQGNGVLANAIARDDVTRLVIVFRGTAGHQTTRFSSLASAVYQFFKRWDDWTRVIMGTLGADPVAVTSDFDWREFLAGESGYVIMPWFSPMGYVDRRRCLSRVVTACRALLNSVLSQEQIEDPLIAGFQDWMKKLEPLVQVTSYTHMHEEVEV
jgi:hypothetical protein